MDLLRDAYADDEPENRPGPSLTPSIDASLAAFRPLKRPRSEYNDPGPRQLAPAPGRYVSKRERAAFSGQPGPAPTSLAGPNPGTPSASAVVGSIADTDIPRDLASSLRKRDSRARPNLMPDKLSLALRSHSKAVNALHWSTTHDSSGLEHNGGSPLVMQPLGPRASIWTKELPFAAHLLASAGMDQSICVWNVWSKVQKLARVFRFHNAAVKDVKWSPNGLAVLSCGYDCNSRLIDVDKGMEFKVFKEDQVVGVLKYHPNNSNLFMSGGSRGRLRLWDIRTGTVVHEYVQGLGSILDVEFTTNGKQFISSGDVSGSNISENNIVVWDISRQVPLSNQVYVEAYTCPSIRCHPVEPVFVAQSNGNYIAIFSSNPPFKLNKYKRYESHGVSGFPIRCNFSLDGEQLVSGSSDGSIYLYNYRSSQLIKKIKAYEQPCVDVAFHPVMPNVIASCSWSGDVSVFE